jgi:hypothetical protein
MGGNSSSENEENFPYLFMKNAINKIENKVPFGEVGSSGSPKSVTFLQEEMKTNDSVVNSIISQFAERSRVGYKKYGTTLDRTDLSLLDWVQHAQEEMMDGILYLEKIKKTIKERDSGTETMER